MEPRIPAPRFLWRSSPFKLGGSGVEEAPPA